MHAYEWMWHIAPTVYTVNEIGRCFGNRSKIKSSKYMSLCISIIALLITASEWYISFSKDQKCFGMNTENRQYFSLFLSDLIPMSSQWQNLNIIRLFCFVIFCKLIKLGMSTFSTQTTKNKIRRMYKQFMANVKKWLTLRQQFSLKIHIHIIQLNVGWVTRISKYQQEAFLEFPSNTVRHVKHLSTGYRYKMDVQCLCHCYLHSYRNCIHC